MANEANSVRVNLDGEWTLVELSNFGRTYTQVYSFLYALDVRAAEARDVETLEEDELASASYDRGSHAFRAYPWRGGYSAVNFYQTLRLSIPPEDLPTIRAIRYSSPGWIDLTLVVGVALNIRRIVNLFAAMALDLSRAYTGIYKELHERNLMRIDTKRKRLELDRETLAFAREASKELAGLMDFKDLRQLRRLAPNELAALKILLSFYRRARDLAEFEKDGKINL